MINTSYRALKHVFLLIFIVCLSFISCKRSTVYESHIETKNLTWHNKDVMSFNFEIKDTSSVYDLYTAIRYIDNCPHSSLKINFTISYQDELCDFFKNEIKIKDDSGNYKGDVMGNIWDYSDKTVTNYKFHKPGNYKINISANSKDNVYLLINEVGLIVKKSTK
ncbi:MAG: hypothetical protein Kow0068_18540 [Marinilabiliales bacterium]